MRNKFLLCSLVFLFLISIVSTNANQNITKFSTFEGSSLIDTMNIDNSSEEKIDVIVNFKKKIDENLLRENDVEVKENIDSIDVSAIKANSKAIEEIQKDPDVESIELDIDLELFGEEQTIPWGIEIINAPKAWIKVTGKNIKIAVIDSGINKYHEDLKIKDGISFIENSNYWDDDLGHGTSVAGVISALNNEVGVIGVAPEAEIYSAKVIGVNGGKLSNLIQGLQWAINNDMDIVVMSLGIPVDSLSLRRIVDEAYLNGIILVAASGKNNEIYYPAKYSSVIAVGSINENNELTNENGVGEELEFVAPGANVISTSINGYGSFDGTSMAAPHVAGVVALLKENNPSLSVNEIRAKLQRDAIDLGGDGKDDYFGYGLININLEEENLDAIIQIVFPEEIDETKKEKYDMNPIRVEIIKLEDGNERVVQTLFYDGNKGTQNISIVPGNYRIKQYFDNKIYSNDYLINEGDIIVVPLHKVDPPVHQWVSYQASFIWSTPELMSHMEEEKYNSRNVWNADEDLFLDDDGYNSYNVDLNGPEGILVGAGEEDTDTQGDYQCVGDYHGNPYCYHFWDPDSPENGNYNDGILLYSSAMTVANVQYNRAVNLYNQGQKDEAYYWLGRVSHLITDMTVPAHVHKDQHVTNDDAFEDFMGDMKGYWADTSGKYNFLHFKGEDYIGDVYSYDNINFPSGVKTNPSNLFKLFWYTAQKTQYYASDNGDGNSYYRKESGSTTYLFSPSLWSGESVTIIDSGGDIEDGHWSWGIYYDDDEGPNLAKIAEANIPHAMKAVAGLYRLFWASVDEDGDAINNLYDNCVYTYNPNQGDNDGDGMGDVCDCSYPSLVDCDTRDEVNQIGEEWVQGRCTRDELGECTTHWINLNNCITPTNGMNITKETIFCTNNYTLPNGVNINTDNILLDCNSSTLIGDTGGQYVLGGPTGITISGAHNVTVKNCKITNYTWGILSSGDLVDYNYLFNNTIYGNWHGIEIINKNKMNHNHIYSNNKHGVVATSSNDDEIEINKNDIYGNKGYDLLNSLSTKINATNNWWGTSNEEEIKNKLFGNITFIPYSNNPINFLPDETPPEITTISPIDASWYNTNSLWLNISTNENATCEYMLGSCASWKEVVEPVNCSVYSNMACEEIIEFDESQNNTYAHCQCEITGCAFACPGSGGGGAGCGGGPYQDMSVTGTTSHSQLIINLTDTKNYANSSETYSEWHTLSINCTDEFGNSNKTSIKFYIDTVEPVIHDYAPKNGTKTDFLIPFNINYSEENLQSVKLRIGENLSYYYGVPASSGGSGGGGGPASNSSSGGGSGGEGGESSDITTPAITFSCSPVDVNIGETINCSCSATDNVNPNPTITYTTNPPTSKTGTFTTTCTATDSSGNSAISIISYDVNSAVGSGGSGGGGGGSIISRTYILSCSSGINQTCYYNKNLSSAYDEGEIEYQFIIEDLANNIVETEILILDIDTCTPNWTSTEICQEDDSLFITYSDSNNCYIQTNLSSDLENKPEDVTNKFSCDYDKDGFVGETNNINTTLQNLTKEINDTSIKINENNSPLIEFDFNLTENTLNLANLFIEKQSNKSTFAYMLVKGLDLTSQNQTKTVYLDKIANTNKLCIIDREITSLSEFSDECDSEDEILLSCPGTSDGYNCSFIKDKTQYKITGLRHSAIKEQKTQDEDGGGGNGNGNGGSPGGGGGSSIGGGSTPTIANQTNITTNQTIETPSQNETESGAETTEGEVEGTVTGGAGITGAFIGGIVDRGKSIIAIIFIVLIVGGIVGIWLWRQKNKAQVVYAPKDDAKSFIEEIE